MENGFYKITALSNDSARNCMGKATVDWDYEIAKDIARAYLMRGYIAVIRNAENNDLIAELNPQGETALTLTKDSA